MLYFSSRILYVVIQFVDFVAGMYQLCSLKMTLEGLKLVGVMYSVNKVVT